MALVKFKVGFTGNVKQRIARVTLDADHLNGGWVAAGWDRAEKYPDGTSIARVALFNEWGSHNADGSVHSPARPFMRPAYQKNKGAILALQITVIRDVLTQKITPEKALNILGFRMWSYIRAAILSNTPPPLAARTLAAKRRAGRPAVTLIDTRRMLDTLSYRIYIGGKGRPPMKEDPVTPGSSGGGGGAVVRPQHAPGGGKPFSPMTPAQVKDIPQVRSPDEIKREKQRLRNEVKKAKKKPVSAHDPSPSAPKGGKRAKSGSRKRPATAPGAGKTKAKTSKPVPDKPRAKKQKQTRLRKATGKAVVKARRTVKKASKRVRKAVKRGVKKTGKTVKRSTRRVVRQAKKALKKARRALRVAVKTAKRVAKAVRRTTKTIGQKAKAAKRILVRAERKARKLSRALGRISKTADKFERLLLRNIITLSRAASRYGRSL